MVANVAVYHGKVMVLVENTLVLYDYHTIYHHMYYYSKHIILSTMVFWTCIIKYHALPKIPWYYHGT